MQPEPKRKNVKIWIALLAGPFIGIFLLFAINLAGTLAFNNASNNSIPATNTTIPATTVQDCTDLGCGLETASPDDSSSAVFGEISTGQAIFNIIVFFLGAIMVLLIMLSPLWIIFLILAINHNGSIKQSSQLQQTQPIAYSQLPAEQPIQPSNIQQQPMQQPEQKVQYRDN